MKVKAHNRRRQIRGMLQCRCCDDLYDRDYKLDKQISKEILEEINGEDVLPGCSM